MLLMFGAIASILHFETKVRQPFVVAALETKVEFAKYELRANAHSHGVSM